MDIGDSHSYITFGTTTKCLVVLQQLFEQRLTSVGWCPEFKVVKNFLDGTVCGNLTNAARKHMGLEVPWVSDMLEREVLTPPVAWSNDPVGATNSEPVLKPVARETTGFKQHEYCLFPSCPDTTACEQHPRGCCNIQMHRN